MRGRKYQRSRQQSRRTQGLGWWVRDETRQAERQDEVWHPLALACCYECVRAGLLGEGPLCHLGRTETTASGALAGLATRALIISGERKQQSSSLHQSERESAIAWKISRRTPQIRSDRPGKCASLSLRHCFLRPSGSEAARRGEQAQAQAQTRHGACAPAVICGPAYTGLDSGSN